MKKFSVHSDNCPDDCGYNYSLGALAMFDIKLEDADKLEIGEILICEHFTIKRDE